MGWEDPPHDRNCNSVFGGTHGPADDTASDFLGANHKVYRLYKCFTTTNSPNAPLLPSSTLSIFCQLPQNSTTLGWLPVFVENDMALLQRHYSPRTCLRLGLLIKCMPAYGLCYVRLVVISLRKSMWTHECWERLSY